MGILHGTDHLFTGKVERVDTDLLQTLLNQGIIPVVPPLGSLLLWQYLLAAIIILFLFHSYIFIGNSPFWEFIEGAGQTLLAPMRRLPLRWGKIDGTPVVALALVFVVAHHGARAIEVLFHRLAP